MVEIVWWRGSAPLRRGGTPSPHSRIMKISAMNSGATANLDHPTIENAIPLATTRPNGFFRLANLRAGANRALGGDLHGRTVAPRLARRCGHGACRGGEGNGAAPRLGDALRQRCPLS